MTFHIQISHLASACTDKEKTQVNSSSWGTDVFVISDDLLCPAEQS